MQFFKKTALKVRYITQNFVSKKEIHLFFLNFSKHYSDLIFQNIHLFAIIIHLFAFIHFFAFAFRIFLPRLTPCLSTRLLKNVLFKTSNKYLNLKSKAETTLPHIGFLHAFSHIANA